LGDERDAEYGFDEVEQRRCVIDLEVDVGV